MSSGESYYRIETTDGCWVITVLPELNDKQWADIEKVGSEIVDRLSNAQSPRFIVDLTPLSYMGSAMVALIVRLYKSVTGRGGQMVVVNQHELVFEVLKLAGLTKLWTIVDSREKAFASLGVKHRAVSGGGAAVPVGGNGILLAGVIGTVGAVLGLALQFSSQPLVPAKIALLIEVLFAALGMVVGTMILVNQSGTRRNVGIAFLAICLLAVLGGIVLGPERPTPRPSSGSSASPIEEAKSGATVAESNLQQAAPSGTVAGTVAAKEIAAPAKVPAQTTAATALDGGPRRKKK